MNLKDTDIENKRKQAIEALVADSTTLAERLLKAEDFGETCRILRGHDYCMERVMALIPERKPIIKEVAPDRFEIALKAVIRRELCDILGKAGEET